MMPTPNEILLDVATALRDLTTTLVVGDVLLVQCQFGVSRERLEELTGVDECLWFRDENYEGWILLEAPPMD